MYLIFYSLQARVFQKLVAYGPSGKNGQNVLNPVMVANKKEEEQQSKRRSMEETNAMEIIDNMKHVTKILVQVRV